MMVMTMLARVRIWPWIVAALTLAVLLVAALFRGSYGEVLGLSAGLAFCVGRGFWLTKYNASHALAIKIVNMDQALTPESRKRRAMFQAYLIAGAVVVSDTAVALGVGFGEHSFGWGLLAAALVGILSVAVGMFGAFVVGKRDRPDNTSQ